MEALRDFFQNRMYGIWRENEQIEYVTSFHVGVLQKSLEGI